jgi:disulfide oxidoreductase YuzD
MIFGYFEDENEIFLEWIEKDLKICDDELNYKNNYIDIFIENSKKPENIIGFFNLLKKGDEKKYPKELILIGCEYLKKEIKKGIKDKQKIKVYEKQLDMYINLLFSTTWTNRIYKFSIS